MAAKWFEYTFDSSEKNLQLLRFYPTSGWTTDQLASRLGSTHSNVLGVQTGFVLDGLMPGMNGTEYDMNALIELLSPRYDTLSVGNDGGIENIASVLTQYGDQFIEIELQGLGGDSLELPGASDEANIHQAILPAYQTTSRGDEVLRGYYHVQMSGIPKIYIPNVAVVPTGTHYAVFLKCFAAGDSSFNSAYYAPKICVAEYDPGEGNWTYLEADAEVTTVSPFYSDFTIVRIATVVIAEGTYSGYLEFPLVGLSTKLKPSIEFQELEEGDMDKKIYVSYFMRDEYSEYDNQCAQIVSRLNEWSTIQKVSRQISARFGYEATETT